MLRLRKHHISLMLGTAVMLQGCQGPARRPAVQKPVMPRSTMTQRSDLQPTLAEPAPHVGANAISPKSDPAAKNEDNTLSAAQKIELTRFEQAQFLNEPTDAIPGQTIPAPLVSESDIATLTASSSGGLSLDQIEDFALQYNPAIRQATSSVHKARGYRQQVGLAPNPTIGYELEGLNKNRSGEHKAVVSQEFVRGQKLQLNRQVLDQEVQSQMWEVEAQRYRVLTDVRTRFYRALAAQRRRQLAIDFHSVVTEGVRIAQLRLEALEGSLPDVLMAEIQLNEVELIRDRAEIAYQAAWKELAAVSGMASLQAQTLIGELRVEDLPLDQDETYAMLIAQSPELQAAKARVQRSLANLTRQEVQAIPNVTGSLSAGYDRGDQNGVFGAGIQIPLPLYNRNQGNISAAQSEYYRACNEVRRIEASLKERLASTANEYLSSAVTVRRMEDVILPKAHQTLELSEKAYQSGEFEYIQVLIARRTYFDSDLAYNDALQELAVSTTRINGMLLEGGLEATRDVDYDDGLRDQSLGGN